MTALAPDAATTARSPLIRRLMRRARPITSLLLFATRDGRPVYLGDVARVVQDGVAVEQRVWRLTRAPDGTSQRAPAVSIAIAKRAGANAVALTEAVRERLALMRGSVISEGIAADVTRDYGVTAQEKSDELLFHLGLATISIVALVWLAIGWREAVVTAVVIPVTILLTLFGVWVLGYTLNRVSLFALIFSIGLLVDDAIVVVETIDRHWSMRDGRGRIAAALDAVAEVGNPTIIATLTVIVALLPMMFVAGLMGPYMGPIPAVASVAMLFSLFVAMTLTPWLMAMLRGASGTEAARAPGPGRLGQLHHALAAPLIERRWRAWAFLLLTASATAAVMLLFVTRDVTVKLLPFDNKSELAVVLDMPAGASLEDTERSLFAAAERLRGVPELAAVTVNAGTNVPFNVNGLVRHYYLRRSPNLGDLELMLAPRQDRARDSRAIALEVRARLADLPLPPDARLRVVEVPPGPPVLATLLAEIYGPDAATRRTAAATVREAFARVPFIVDLEDTIRDPGRRLRFTLLPGQLACHGVEEQVVYETLRTLLGGVAIGYAHRGKGRNPIAITVRLPRESVFPIRAAALDPCPRSAQHGQARRSRAHR